MHIDFILDTVCAWSYIAKRRLDEAILAFPRLKFDICVHPFLIAPPAALWRDRPEIHIDMAARTRELRQKIEPAAREVGLVINFDALPSIPDSVPSHILVRYGFEQNKGMETLEAVFSAYFIRGENIGDPDVLSCLAKQCGLDTETLRKKMDTDFPPTSLPLLWRKSGVRGIPCFIFDQKTLISGAQSIDVFKRMIELYLTLRQENTKNREDFTNFIENPL